LPNEEIFGGKPTEGFGGHHDLLYSHPVFWLPGRSSGQPLVEDNPKYRHGRWDRRSLNSCVLIRVFAPSPGNS
jgi:hypothetical protein